MQICARISGFPHVEINDFLQPTATLPPFPQVERENHIISQLDTQTPGSVSMTNLCLIQYSVAD